MKKNELNENIGWFLAFAGVSAFVFSLFHPKSRIVTKKVVSVGGGLALSYVAKNYLPVLAQNLTKMFILKNQKKY